VQRLFSMFPSSWPGAALLLFRLVAAVSLAASASGLMSNHDAAHSEWRTVVALVDAALLTVGLYTPFAALGQVVLEISSALHDSAPLGTHALLAAIGAGLILLGPGACSIDAALFGRRQIDLDNEQ
jgi:putative oxidoreductase